MMDSITGKRKPGRPALAPGERLRTAGIRLSGEDFQRLTDTASAGVSKGLKRSGGLLN